MNTLYMCLWRPTHSQYTQQRVVATLGDLIIYDDKQGSTHISEALFFSAIVEGVGYEVHRYMTIGLLPYEEWSEQQPWTDEEQW